MPGSYFENVSTNIRVNTETVSWMGEVNVGSFLIAYGVGIILTIKKFQPDKVDWKSRPGLLLCMIVAEATCAICILYVTIY